MKGTTEDKNIEWKEEDHNRDERGRFASKIQKQYFEPTIEEAKDFEDKIEIVLNPRLPYDNEKSNKTIKLKVCNMPFIYKK